MVRELILKYALNNALGHSGKANPGSILGMILSQRPELRADVKGLMSQIQQVVAEVNALGLDQQKEQLMDIAPELLEKKKAAPPRVGLPDLADVEDGGIRVRFAPGPSGPLHIGHTRAVVLNDEYVRRYGGKFILRLEDTNPSKIDLEAYDSIPADLEWLGVKVHETYIQSDRMEHYHGTARKLLEQGHAYMCTCPNLEWRELKGKGQACKHREAPIPDQLELWDKMFNGHFLEGEVSCMVKTDLAHPNPAVRDFVALRIVEQDHPRTGDKHRIYPLYNFSVAVDDHLMGMTHVLRGKDHLNNTYRQEYLYDYLGWKKPKFIHYGWVSIKDTILKTSVIKEGILNGTYTGWDDVRVGTLKALARRGIRPEAIRKYWVDVGTKEVDIQFSWPNLYSANKELIDDGAGRCFFVPNPVRIQIESALEGVIEGEVEGEIEGQDLPVGHPHRHPAHPELGSREIHLESDGSNNWAWIPKEELDALAQKDESRIRLKDMGNIEQTEGAKFRYIGNDLSILKQGVGVVQWAGKDNVQTSVLMNDGSLVNGACEAEVLLNLGKMVQFERFGFVRLEPDVGVCDGKQVVSAIFAHK